MRKMFLILVVLIIFVATACELRLESKPKSTTNKSFTTEELVVLYSEIIATSEIFASIDGFDSFAFYRFDRGDDESEVFLVVISFNEEISLGVKEFRIRSEDLQELKLKTRQLAEETRYARGRPGS